VQQRSTRWRHSPAKVRSPAKERPAVAQRGGGTVAVVEAQRSGGAAAAVEAP
jgi:hypothetical protein